MEPNIDIDWSVRQRLQREQRELKAPQRKDHSLRAQHPVATTALKLPVCRRRLKPCPRNASAWNGNPRLITRIEVSKRTFSVCT